MAPTRSKSNSRKDHSQRVHITRTLPKVLLAQQILQLLEQQNREYNEPQQDRRRYNPSRVTPVKTLNGKPARFNHNRLGTLYQNPWQLLRPDKVGICVRRKTRREVLHALRRTGKGSSSKRKYSPTSYYRC